MSRGGYRPGAGRKKGSATLRSRDIADRLAACKGELSPLEVMVEGMRRVWRQALEEQDRTQQLDLILKACGLARDAASYVHPRLASINATLRRITDIRDLSDDEISALVRSVGGEVIDSPAEPLALPASRREIN
jgi:hypothetical protein